MKEKETQRYLLFHTDSIGNLEVPVDFLMTVEVS